MTFIAIIVFVQGSWMYQCEAFVIRNLPWEILEISLLTLKILVFLLTGFVGNIWSNNSYSS